MDIRPTVGSTNGKITIVGVILDKLRKIYTHLTDSDYALAVKAYQERIPVICTGDLVKENHTFILKNPRHFDLDEAWQN